MPAVVEELSAKVKTWNVPTPPGGVKRGEIHQIGDVFGFSLATSPDPTSGPTASVVGTIPDTEKYAFAWQVEGGGGLRVPKDPAQTVSRGTRAFYHPGNEWFTDVATGGDLVGFWLEDAAPGDTHGVIDFDGRLHRI